MGSNTIHNRYYYGMFVIMALQNHGYITGLFKGIHNWIFYYDKKKNTQSFIFNLLIKLPYFKRQLDNEVLKIKTDVINDVSILETGIPRMRTLPKIGLTQDWLDTTLTCMQSIDLKNTNKTKISGTLYNTPDSDEIALQKRVMDFYYKTNPLHADMFPSLVTMEKDIISMTKTLFNCPNDEGTGTVTTGGTESIILALFGYREYAKKYKGICRPEMIAPSTVHPAFDKGCYYLGIKLHKITIDVNNQLDFSSLKWHINHNTILLVGSAPSFPHGLMDDIPKLSDIAIDYNIPLHVDACLGGFVLAFLDRPTEFDFSIDGVSSISADTHKYGCCPKGSSTLIFRKKQMFECCYFIQSEWSGGIYATTNITGSRSGLNLAWTWSMLNYQGYNQLKAQANNIVEHIAKIKSSFANDSDIYIFGDPNVCVVGFGSNTINIYDLSEKMKHLGWNLNELQKPDSFHLCVTNCHTQDSIDTFIKDIKSSLTSLVSTGQTGVVGSSIYGTTQKVPDQGIIDNVVVEYLNAIHL
jgi:sphinganine-1-phosphate aldolase